MTGLLYQDFCVARGKWMLRILAFSTLLLAAAVFWGDSEGIDGAFLMALLGCVAVCHGISLPEKIFASDEKNAVRIFLRSLPYGGWKYVAEKYVFVGLYYYILANLLSVLQFFVMAGIREKELTEEIVQNISMLHTLVFLLLVAALLVAAVEFPFLFAFGSRAARYSKTLLVAGLFFAGMIWVLFDPAALEEGGGVASLLEWMTGHQEEVTLFHIAMPVIVVLLYFLSYKGSVFLFQTREEMYE